MTLLAIAADAAHSGEKAAFPPFESWHFPSQIFWLLLLFGFLYFVLSRFILPRLGAVLENRESSIADDLDEAARMNDRAVQAQHAVELSIAKAQATARDTATKTRLKIDAEITAETAKIDADLDSKLKAAEARIGTLRDSAMQNVEAIASEATASILARFDGAATPASLGKAVKSALSGN